VSNLQSRIQLPAASPSFAHQDPLELQTQTDAHTHTDRLRHRQTDTYTHRQTERLLVDALSWHCTACAVYPVLPNNTPANK